MAAKTIGAEFKQFYNDKAHWPEDAWHEDSSVLVDGQEQVDLDVEKIADDAKVVIDAGVVYLSQEDRGGISLVTFFNRWKKVRNTRVLIVDVPVEKVDAVLAAIKAAGGKVR